MSNRAAFIGMLMPAAIEASQRTGIDPRIIVAQAAQETGWGRSAPGNNYFGIKSHGQGGGQNLTTHEVINGQRVKINDSFRAFNSPADSVAGYADFMSSNKRYTPMRTAQGLDAQLSELGKSGYATDPNYASSVGAIARSIPLDGNYQPSPYAGMPDGPKGSESYAPPAQPTDNTAVASIWGGGGTPGGAPAAAYDRAAAMDAQDQPNIWDKLAVIGNSIDKSIPQAPGAGGSYGGQGGNMLAQVMNQPNMGDTLLQRRLAFLKRA